MNNKSSIFLLILVIVLFFNGYSQNNWTIVKNDEMFYKKIDYYIENANKLGQIMLDTSNSQGIHILFDIKIDTNYINHSVSILKSNGVVFLPGSADSLCVWIKESFIFNYIVDFTPDWRFVNNICTFHFPYNNYNDIRDSRIR